MDGATLGSILMAISNCVINNRCNISGQDGRIGKCSASILSWLHQNYKWRTEEAQLRIAWTLAEQKSYKCKDIEKKPRWDWWEGWRNGEGWSQANLWQLKIRKDVLAVEVYPGDGGERGPRPTIGSSVQSSNARKRSLHNFWLWKPAGLWLIRTEGSWHPRNSYWGAHTWTCLLVDLLVLASSTAASAWEVPRTYGKELNCLASEWELEGKLFPR